jgi:hypothetical protein
MPVQQCPICKIQVTPSERYPHYVCASCVERAADVAGRKVAFYNTELSGSGCEGRYRDDGSLYASDRCWIDGVPCRAAEAHMGGIVVQPMAS